MTDLEQAKQQQLAPWDDMVWEDFHVAVFRDRYPVTPGHLLFVPKYNNSHILREAFFSAQIEGDKLVDSGDCDGYNIGLNMGRSAGQTVMYPHVHLIPRRHGDCTDPTGGVRGVIPGQQNYHRDGYQIPSQE